MSIRLTLTIFVVWGPQGQNLDSGLGDSVREQGCHYEGKPSRAQTIREGKPSGAPEWARVVSVFDWDQWRRPAAL